jgi:hypothetical protein
MVFCAHAFEYPLRITLTLQLRNRISDKSAILNVSVICQVAESRARAPHSELKLTLPCPADDACSTNVVHVVNLTESSLTRSLSYFIGLDCGVGAVKVMGVIWSSFPLLSSSTLKGSGWKE